MPAPRRPAHLRGRLHRPGGRCRHRRAAARRRARLALRHRAVQDRAARSSATTSWTCPTCTRRGSAAAGRGCARWAPSPGGATTWSSCEASTSGPKRSATSPARSTASPPTTSCGPCGVNNRDELVVSVVSERDPAEFAAIAAEIERVLQQRFGLKIAATVVAPRRARRPHRVPHLPQVQALPRRTPDALSGTRQPSSGRNTGNMKVRPVSSLRLASNVTRTFMPEWTFPGWQSTRLVSILGPSLSSTTDTT